MGRAIVVALAVLTFGVASAAPAEAGAEPSDAEGLLAVVNAAGGSFRETDDGYRLVLTGVVPRAVWFSDRPARSVGSFAIDEFIDAFFGGDDDPNAALEVFGGRAAGDVVVVELSNPRYERGRTRLVFDARVLGQDDVAATALSDHAERAAAGAPARFGAAALYIDDGSCLLGDGGDGGVGGTGGEEATAGTC